MRINEEIIIMIDIETIDVATVTTESVDTGTTAIGGREVTISGGETTATTGDRAIAVNELVVPEEILDVVGEIGITDSGDRSARVPTARRVGGAKRNQTCRL